MKMCADDVRDSMPLFRSGCGGSTPTSALQIRFHPIGLKCALDLNRLWHSRMPNLPLWNVRTKHGFAYVASYEGRYYATAIWSTPIARQLDTGTILELRRMAISEDAPKNLASRMLGWMVRELRKDPQWTNAISYQDTEVHRGTIYKASGWIATNTSTGKTGWDTGGKTYGSRRKVMTRHQSQGTAPKVRWEMSLQ